MQQHALKKQVVKVDDVRYSSASKPTDGVKSSEEGGPGRVEWVETSVGMIYDRATRVKGRFAGC